MARNELMVSIREFIRQPCAFPGGYPKVLIMADGDCLCAACAKSNYRQVSNETRNSLPGGWKAAVVDIHWEGAPLQCAQCNVEIESAYGEVEQ